MKMNHASIPVSFFLSVVLAGCTGTLGFRRDDECSHRTSSADSFLNSRFLDYHTPSGIITDEETIKSNLTELEQAFSGRYYREEKGMAVEYDAVVSLRIDDDTSGFKQPVLSFTPKESQKCSAANRSTTLYFSDLSWVAIIDSESHENSSGQVYIFHQEDLLPESTLAATTLRTYILEVKSKDLAETVGYYIKELSDRYRLRKKDFLASKTRPESEKSKSKEPVIITKGKNKPPASLNTNQLEEICRGDGKNARLLSTITFAECEYQALSHLFANEDKPLDKIRTAINTEKREKENSGFLIYCGNASFPSASSCSVQPESSNCQLSLNRALSVSGYVNGKLDREIENITSLVFPLSSILDERTVRIYYVPAHDLEGFHEELATNAKTGA